MAIVWSDRGARAVVPSVVLHNGKEPVAATYGTTVDAPQPLGVGVNVLLPNGHRRALPLFFVSEHAAESRDIESGWYIGADMGQRFEILVSNVHPDD